MPTALFPDGTAYPFTAATPPRTFAALKQQVAAVSGYPAEDIVFPAGYTTDALRDDDTLVQALLNAVWMLPMFDKARWRFVITHGGSFQIMRIFMRIMLQTKSK